MSERDDALEAYEAALVEPSASNLDALRAALDADVVVLGPVGPGRGIDGVRDALEHPRRPGFLALATFSAPTFDGDEADVEVVLPAGGPLAGLGLHVAFAEGRIVRVEQVLRMAPPPEPTPLALSDELRAIVDGALANGTPLTVAYVDADGAPHLSPRGSTSAHSPTQLAMWVRDPAGGLLAAIGSNPHVALLYRDPATGASFQFAGRARDDADDAVRDEVYGRAPAPERNLDARRLGRAVVIDLDRVEGTGPTGRVRMVAGS